MIRIQRPTAIPAVLSGKGARARANLVAAHARGEALDIDNAIYGHKSVKEALVQAQHGKCCFCESKVTHISSGHIEHYRPKGGYRDRAGKPLVKPGYFWLAYEWTNLLFCCEVCNSRHKGNVFPLRRGGKRANTPRASLSKERPLFIDPASEDPSRHIGYREEYPYAVGGSARGQATWQALGLDREDLAERRREHLDWVKRLILIRDCFDDPVHRADAASVLEKLTAASAQWSAMVRAAIANAPARPGTDRKNANRRRP